MKLEFQAGALRPIGPEEVAAVRGLAGTGLIGVAKDNFETSGRNMSYAIGFAEVEVDTETGAVRLKDYKVASDAGTVVNPRTFAAQLHGGGVQGFGVALGQKWVYDRKWGLHVSKRFYSNRPPTMLDMLGAPPLAGVDGRSVRPFIGHEDTFDNAASYFEADGIRGVVRGTAKLIVGPTSEFYDLREDPAEQKNLFNAGDSRVADLQKTLADLR